jgi:hypothetical protein
LKQHGISFSVADGRLQINELDDPLTKKERRQKEKEARTKKTPMTLSALKKMRAKKQMSKLAKKGHTIQGMQQFRPGKKSCGDAKRQNKMEPYAYMRLNPKMVNEKHKVKSLASIKQVVKTSKKDSKKNHNSGKRGVKKNIGKKKINK